MSRKPIRHTLPSLSPPNSIIGFLDEEPGDNHRVVHFRGIPYARFDKRWTHSRTIHDLGSSSPAATAGSDGSDGNAFDAREFGPRCPQAARPYENEDDAAVMAATRPADEEFACLNLNVCVPAEQLGKCGRGEVGGLLPVMVWIHGGAFAYGSNSIARYDARGLSLLAAQIGTPIILVQINYRLGALGFAASADLATESSSSSSFAPSSSATPPDPSTTPPTAGNYGFIDQRNALQWVQDHIRDFGGDPDNVTAFGVSAGSACVHFHILGGDPLFDRAILMSGPGSVLGPQPYGLAKAAWDGFCLKVGVRDDGDVAAKLERLRALDPMEVLTKYPAGALAPVADGVILPKSWSVMQKQAPTRCKSIILGDVSYEGVVMDRFVSALPPETFHQHLDGNFSAADASSFRQLFRFPPAATSTLEAYQEAFRLFLGTLAFVFPNFMVAERFPAAAGPAYLFHFEEPSPFPGPTLGRAYHGLSALFVCQNKNAELPESGRRTAREMGTIWTAYAYGKEPWEAYGHGKRFMRFGPRGISGLFDVGSDDTRDYESLEWLRNHYVDVLKFFGSLPLGIKAGKDKA